MRAVGFLEFGESTVLREMELPDPKAGEGEAVVRVSTTSVNVLDVMVRRGYKGISLTLPHVPGTDVVGRIEALGPGASGFSVGDKIIAAPLFGCGICPACLSGNEVMCRNYGAIGRNIWGSYGSLVRLKASLLLRQPPGFSDDELATLPLSLSTAWRAIRLAAPSPGSTGVVWGASGNVGLFSVLLLKSMGVRVVSLTRSDMKAQRLKALGSDLVVNTVSGTDAIRKEVLDFTDGLGAEFVIDSFGSTIKDSLNLTREAGKVICFGVTGGDNAEISVKDIYLKAREVIGTHAANRSEFADALSYVAARNIHPIIGKVMGIGDAAKAHSMLEQSEVFGKLVLRHRE